MNKEKKAIIQMLICATLWSIAGIFIKLIPWNGFVVAGMRSLIAGITLFAAIRIMGYEYILNKKTIITGIFSGLTYICFVCANKLTTAANAIVLQFTSPVFIVIYSALFFKKPVRKQDLTVVIFTLLGIALFFLDKLESGYILGNIVAISAGLFMAGMFVAVGAIDEEERYSGILNGQILAFLVGLPFMIATKPVFSPVAVLSILILGVFQLGIAYVLYVKSSRYCPPLACCLLGAVEPLLNPVWVFLFDGERPGVFALFGSVIVIVSITIWCLYNNRKAEEL